ncbi:MAG: MmgE/PrpD family protein [Acidimicrobiia bacterium]
MTDVADVYAEHTHRLTIADLPEQTRRKTKLLVLDTLGAILAANGADGCDELMSVVRSWGSSGKATALGYGDKLPAHAAALMNATLGRALELDDVHEVALIHATVSMVPIALAVAEQHADAGADVTGATFLTAVAAGFDIAARIAIAPELHLGGDQYKPRSLSRTYMTSTLAGALVAAKVARLDVEQTKDAFGNAYSNCAGNLQGLAEGTLTVRTQQGVSAMAAVMAMDFARAGISGTRQSLEGKYGYFQTYFDLRYDRNVLLDDLGVRYEGDSSSIKPYACCKYAHTGIAAALEIRGREGFDARAIDRVAVHVQSRDCWDLLCEPPATKTSADLLAAPSGWALAQFSYPYTVAAALLRGSFTTDDLTLAVRTDPELLELIDKVDLVLDDNTRGNVELPEPGHVEVTMRDGTHHEAIVKRAIGHPDRPMSEAEMRDKFRWCARRLPASRVEQLADLVLDIENVGDVRELVALC